MDMLGQTIGQYQLIEVIHQGDNAVYKGFQPAMNRYVAVNSWLRPKTALPLPNSFNKICR
jgi:hypothetical protein